MYSADTLSRIPRRDSKSLVPTVNILDVNSFQEFVQREFLLSRIDSSFDTNLFGQVKNNYNERLRVCWLTRAHPPESWRGIYRCGRRGQPTNSVSVTLVY